MSVTKISQAGLSLTEAFSGVLQTNANFVDQVIFGPSVDGRPWNGLWSKASVFSSLMLATIEDEGSNTEINIWDLTEQSAGAVSTTPLATVDLASAATPTSVAACMGYLIVGSEDGTHIIDPHDGSWAERTAGWPITLSTSSSPALVNNDVQAVAATISDGAPYDPRTGGFIPTFACTYGTGAAEASIIKDDGVVYDNTGFTVSAAGAKAIGFIGQEIYFGCENTGDTIRLSTLPIAAIQADDWATNNTLKKARASDNFLGCDGGSAFSYEQAVFADSDGLSIYRDPVSTTSAQEGLTAMMNRTYNTGYFSYDTKGAWLANSKTADRVHDSTLTENGTVTEGAVESGAELNGYSGFSNSTNYFSRAFDADFDFGTGNFSAIIWFKRTGTSGVQYLWARKSTASGGSNIFCSLADGGHTLRMFIGDGSNSTDNSGISYTGSVWNQAAIVWDGTLGTNSVYINGVLRNVTTNASVGSLTNSNATLAVGATDNGTDALDQGSVSLFRLSTRALSSTQVRNSYLSEKGMFVASAECLLQSGSTDAVLNVDIDPLTGKVLVTQTDAITVFKKGGLVVDSKPTVNSGSSEKGRLWGDLRSEQNSANAYVTAPATDQRQVNEMVRGLASDLPKGVDLSKAKAFVNVSNASTPAIESSYNIESISRPTTGQVIVNFGIPFKADKYIMGAMPEGGADITITQSTGNSTKDHARFETYNAGSLTNLGFSVVFFGELENE